VISIRIVITALLGKKVLNIWINWRLILLETWNALSFQTAPVSHEYVNAIHSVATGDIPAIVVRGAYSEENCRLLLQRLFDRKLFVGFEEYGRGGNGRSKIERFDLGTSLGNLANNPDEFFTQSKQTNELYEHLFDGLVNPVHVLYHWLEQFSGTKSALTAHEPDGRRYGPAIFRCHMPNWGYPPHIDSVRNKGSTLHASAEKRTQYAVHRFEHQLGGVLLLQDPEEEFASCDSILYRCEWNNEFEDMMETVYLGLDEPEANMISADKFEHYVQANSISTYEVNLSPGDLYFFRAECPHVIPKFLGKRPRITLATFFGYTQSDPEIFVWS
jgi:hypothetical protein